MERNEIIKKTRQLMPVCGIAVAIALWVCAETYRLHPWVASWFWASAALNARALVQQVQILKRLGVWK